MLDNWAVVERSRHRCRGPGFESINRQLLLNNYILLTVCRKDENNEKEGWSGPFLK